MPVLWLLQGLLFPWSVESWVLNFSEFVVFLLFYSTFHTNHWSGQLVHLILLSKPKIYSWIFLPFCFLHPFLGSNSITWIFKKIESRVSVWSGQRPVRIELFWPSTCFCVFHCFLKAKSPELTLLEIGFFNFESRALILGETFRLIPLAFLNLGFETGTAFGGAWY